ncbi:MAG: hypothetical protein JTT13_10970 [Candidatus Brockarchaeota archaeon]|nr:hypothetical protein [Candidatus Brockarchaeota archaeon]
MCGKFDVIGLGMSCVDCVLKVEDTANLSRGKVLDWTIQGVGKPLQPWLPLLVLGQGSQS